MKLFLQLVGAMIVALLIVIIALYLYIRWKFRSLFQGFTEALKNLGASQIPPFRVKLRRTSEYFGPDEDDYLENKEDFLDQCDEFAALGFEKIDNYYIEEFPVSMTAFVDRNTSTYGAVYDHPLAGVWCDVFRRYEDGSGWSFGTNRDPLVDYPVDKTVRFFPDLPLAEVVRKFKAEAPSEHAMLVSNEEFPRFFERAYAEEMDWRIERGGATEAEIRRICERDEVECTPKHIQTIQMQWRVVIAEFQKERILRRYRKEAGLSRSDWDHLEDEGVVVYESMQAEEILQAFDEGYVPDIGYEFEEDEDPEFRAMLADWDQKLEEIREQLKTDPPQTIFRRMVENSGQTEYEWEFKASVEKPVPADIWLRHWKDEDDDLYDDLYDEHEDDWDE